jgi:hypothetical protein
MDDHLRTPDELASAYLDDELDDAARAQVESDPALLARVDELRAVQALLSTPPPALDPTRREAMIAAALIAFDEGATASGVDDRPTAPVTASGPVPEGAAVVSIASRRRRITGWVAAAAAAVVLVAGVGMALDRSGGDDTDAADQATQSKEEGADAAASVPAEEPLAAGEDRSASAEQAVETDGAETTAAAADDADPAAGGAEASTAISASPSELPDLGLVDTPEALRAALTSLSAEQPAPGEAADREPVPCEDVAGLRTAILVWQGTLAEVRVDGTTAPAIARVVDVATCSVLTEVPLS